MTLEAVEMEAIAINNHHTWAATSSVKKDNSSIVDPERGWYIKQMVKVELTKHMINGTSLKTS